MRTSAEEVVDGLRRTRRLRLRDGMEGSWRREEWGERHRSTLRHRVDGACGQHVRGPGGRSSDRMKHTACEHACQRRGGASGERGGHGADGERGKGGQRIGRGGGEDRQGREDGGVGECSRGSHVGGRGGTEGSVGGGQLLERGGGNGVGMNCDWEEAGQASALLADISREGMRRE